MTFFAPVSYTHLAVYKRQGYARSIDIARELGVSKPSVSVAMKNLRENGYIEMDPEGLLSLTDKGLSLIHI